MKVTATKWPNRDPDISVTAQTLLEAQELRLAIARGTNTWPGGTMAPTHLVTALADLDERIAWAKQVIDREATARKISEHQSST